MISQEKQQTVNPQSFAFLDALKSGVTGESHAWIPCIRRGKAVIWRGYSCRNRDQSSDSGGRSAHEVASKVLDVLRKGSDFHREHVRLCWQSISGGCPRPGAGDRMRAYEAFVNYAIREADTLRAVLEAQ